MTNIKEKTCSHNYVYKSESVRLHDVNEGWFSAIRVIIFCTKCGNVTHDLINNNATMQYNHKTK